MERTINLDGLKEMVGDDKEVIKEMLEIFVQDVPEYLQTINQAKADNNWPTIATTAHTLKSTVSFTGRNDLVAIAETLQYQKTTPTDPKMHELLQEFIDKLTMLISEVNEMLASNSY